MKYYLFLTSLIRKVGGGHIYTVSKMDFLQSKGFKVGFFHADIRQGEILIDELIPYKDSCDSHLQYPAYFFNKKTQDRIIASIYAAIPKEAGEIIIESQTLICSTWGELLAKKCHAKHIVYILAEDPKIRNRTLYRFLKFKLERRELAGITKQSLPILFKNWQDLKEKESYRLSARLLD